MMNKKSLLYIGHPHATPEKEDWYKALQKKYECTWYTGNEPGIHDKPYDMDLIYIHAGSISRDILVWLKTGSPTATIVQWTGDCRDDLMPDVLKLKWLVDITLLACGMGEQKAMYEKKMGKVEWFPHGVAEWMFKPINENAKGIVFIGNNYGLFSGDIERAKVIHKLKETYGDLFKVYGNGWGDIGEGTVPFEDTFQMYNDSLISIGASIFHDKEGYFSNRPLFEMAAGSLTPIKAFPSVRQFFPLHWTWNDFYDLKEKIDEAINKPDLRNFTAKQQQDYVRNNYHYDVLVNKFEEIVG